MFEILWALAVRYATLSMIAVGGGMTIIPALHADAVTHMHWLDDRSFIELTAISQFSPGPNILLMPLIGWHVAGWSGALVALLAFVLPSGTLAFFTGRFLLSHGERPWLILLRASLRPISAGLLVAAGFILVQSTGMRVTGYGIAAVSAVLAFSLPRVNPLWWLGLAAGSGALLHQLA